MTHLHASPPCNSISPRNRKRCLSRFKELVPLLEEVGLGMGDLVGGGVPEVRARRF